ncbi:MAG: hypothetical protein GY771_17220 [bacterium]|nr:hypothetical protein [bacterium]
MKHLLVLTVIFVTTALGAMDTHLEGEPNGSGVLEWAHNSSKDVIVDNLVTESGQITNGYSLYNGNNWWAAIDWVVSGGDWDWDHWIHDVLPLGATKYDLFMEIYETDPNTSPIDSFTVPVGNITSTDTGLSAFGITNWRNDMDVSGLVSVNSFNDGTTYWIALSYDAPIDNIFWSIRDDSIIDDCIWFYDGSEWHDGID